MDPDLAERIAEHVDFEAEDDAPPAPLSPAGWTPEHQDLVDIKDLLKALIYVSGGAAGPEPMPEPRPTSALQQARDAYDRGKAMDLARRFLPHND